MKESVIRNPYYIPLTLHKHFLLLEGTKKNPFGSKYFYWIDSGIFSSYHIQENINDFYFAKTPRDQFFMTTFPYHSDSEMHGYNMKGMEETCGNIPKYVCRATYFGGTKEQIQKIFEYYHEEMWQSISGGYIGTEESIYTILSYKFPDMFHLWNMPTGDIYNFLQKIK